MEATIIYN